MGSVTRDSTLEQRVEALEQLSHSRVVERVGNLEQRVARMESARDTGEPHLATKADIVRLETKIDAQTELLNGKIDAQAELFQEKLDAQSGRIDQRFDAQAAQTGTMFSAQSELFQEKLDAQAEQTRTMFSAQSELFQEKLDAQSKDIRREVEQRINRLTLWIVGTGIALAALIVSRMPPV